MIKTTLHNIKKDVSKSYLMFKPSKINQNKYEICFSSDSTIFLQFVLYVKFVNFIEISQPENLSSKNIKYNSFPYNGIIYSCKINSSNPLIISIDPIDLCAKIIIKKEYITPINSIKLNPIQWDKILVINLERRPERKKQMEDFFIKSNIPESHYEFITAYDGQEPIIQSQYNEKKKINPSYTIITSGHFACLLSHIKSIQLAKLRGYKNVMILEDDVNTSEPDLVSKLNSIQVPQFDLLYLGGIMSKKKHFTTEWAYSNKTNIMGAYGYILSSKIFDKILSELENLNEYIDIYYLKHIQPNYKTICLEDIIKTDLTTSDTSNKSKVMIKRLDYIK
jgi:hypothetical protein